MDIPDHLFVAESESLVDIPGREMLPSEAGEGDNAFVRSGEQTTKRRLEERPHRLISRADPVIAAALSVANDRDHLPPSCLGHVEERFDKVVSVTLHTLFV